MTYLSSLIAILLYLAGSALLFRRTASGFEKPRLAVTPAVICAALLAHYFSVIPQVMSEQGFDFSFFNVSSLIFLFITMFGLFSLLRKQPVENLLIALLPLAALSILCALLLSSEYTPRSSLAPGVAAHIVLSILASSILTLAAVQAVLLAVQMQQLKGRQTSGLIHSLPPLETMEWVLSRLLYLGFGLLSAALVVGAIFVEDLFAQQLSHKTFFSIAAWAIFAILIYGRTALGWRGRQAVRWTLLGVTLLMLGFFGSKLVLELILQRP